MPPCSSLRDFIQGLHYCKMSLWYLSVCFVFVLLDPMLRKPKNLVGLKTSKYLNDLGHRMPQQSDRSWQTMAHGFAAPVYLNKTLLKLSHADLFTHVFMATSML